MRLVGNHPLPDGNKRAAWVTLRADWLRAHLSPIRPS